MDFINGKKIFSVFTKSLILDFVMVKVGIGLCWTNDGGSHLQIPWFMFFIMHRLNDSFSVRVELNGFTILSYCP